MVVTEQVGEQRGCWSWIADLSGDWNIHFCDNLLISAETPPKIRLPAFFRFGRYFGYVNTVLIRQLQRIAKYNTPSLTMECLKQTARMVWS